MEGEEGILTGIDSLVRYLGEHGESESNALAVALGVSERNIEDWAKILEKANVIKITYKLGKFYVSVIGQKEGKIESWQTSQVKRTILESEISAQLGDVNKIGQRIDEFSKFVTAGENIFKTKAGDIKDAIDRITRLQNELNSNYKDITKKKGGVDKFAQELAGKLAALNANAQEIESFSIDPSNAMAVVQDIRQKLDSFQHGTDELVKRFDKTVEEQRRGMMGLVANIKAEDGKLRELISTEERQLSEYQRRASAYRSDAKSIKRRFEKEKSVLTDAVNKTKTELERTFNAMQKEMDSLNNMLESSKKSFGGFVDLNEKLNAVKNDIAKVTKEKDQMRRKLESLMTQLKSLESESRSPRERVSSLNEIEKKTIESSAELDDTATRIRDIGSDIGEIAK